ncbi:CLUMA_CG018285, isoform A [Clunio marinus]|uniref:CLUMA_CG018285, isoform A n=1 Tax=Clunio marinus TaxID=568069 RepID=A0A1J1IYG1_9DIPT|nr:CLUMA_CG018285, isoform A [Clunio marinus]
MWKKLYLFLLLHLTIGAFINFKIPNYSTALARAVIDLIDNYYATKSHTIHMFCTSIENESSSESHYVMNEVIRQIDKKVAIDVLENLNSINNGSILANKKHKNVDNVFFCNSQKSLFSLINNITTKTFEYDGSYAIVIIGYVGDIYEFMSEIFQNFWIKHIVNVNVLWKTSDDQNEEAFMFTFYPFHSSECGDTTPVQINTFHDDIWAFKAHAFPNKMKNLYGCPLQITLSHQFPFIYWKDGSLNGTIEDLEGVEADLLKVLSETMNFTSNLTMFDEEISWGEIYDNGTSTGPVQAVIEGKANFTMGFFTELPERDKYMKASHVYYTSELIFVVPPGKFYTPLEILLSPFQLTVWIFFFIAILLALLTIEVLSFLPLEVRNFVIGRNVKYAGLNVTAVVLGVPMHKLPTRNFAKTLLILFTFLCFIINNSYRGSLFKNMQKTLTKPPMASNEELFKTDFKFYIYYSDYLLIPELTHIIERSISLDDNEFNLKYDDVTNPDFKGALMSMKDYVKRRNKLKHRNGKTHLRSINDAIFQLNVVTYLNEESNLVHEMNEIILRLIDGGLIKEWAKRAFGEDIGSYPKDDTTEKALSIKHLMGSFYLLGSLLLLSTIIFIAEISIVKLKK